MSDAVTPGQEPEEKKTSTDPDPWEKFPAEFNWVRKELEDARKEAADKRVAARELSEKLAEAKTPEDVQKLTAAYDEKIAELETRLVRERVARDTKLPDELLEFLTGKTEEEMKAQAAKLTGKKKKDDEDDDDQTVVVTQLGPRGGQKPNDPPTPTNGHDEWEKFKKNRH
jgi:hypothetical protein